MANFATANLVKAQAIMTGLFNSGELRYRVPATFQEFVKNTEIMVPSHKEIRTSVNRAVEVNYFARKSRSLTNARTHNHTGARGDSGVLTPSWTPYVDGFRYSLKQANNSIYTLERQIAYEFGEVIANFAEGLETAAVDYLFNNRSGVNSYAAQGTFNATQDVFEINEANEQRAVQIIKSAMDVNKYQGSTYTFFCDTIAYDKFEFQANQGQGNSDNLSFQYSNVTFVKSPELDALAAGLTTPYTKGFVVAVPTGMISVLDWVNPQNRQGMVTKENVYGTVLNPVDGLLYGTHQYVERSDESASGGETQDVKTEVSVDIDLAFEHAPLSTANATPLLAFSIV